MSGEGPSSPNEQERQRLLNALRESEILRELSELLASSLDLKRTLQLLTQRTAEVCQTERCSVWLVSDACHIFHPAAYYLSTQRIDIQSINAADNLWNSGSVTFDDPDIFQLLNQQGIVILPDLHARPGAKNIPDTFMVRSILLVALKRDGQIVGMLSLDDPGKLRTFSDEQQQLVRAIGQQAALAIDNARLYQEAQKARLRSERLIEREAQLLADLHRAAALANERANTLDAVFQAMTEGIIVLSPDRQVLVSNSAAAHFLGVPINTSERLETFFQRHPTYNLHGQPLAIEDFPLSRALRGELMRGERFITSRYDGVERVLEVSITPMLDEVGQQIGLVSAFRDITEQTSAEQRIRRALETMLHVAEAVSGITEIKDILYSVLQRTLLTLNCHRGLVQLYDADQQTFIPLMSIGFSSETEAQWLLEESLWLAPQSSASHSFPAQLSDGHATVISSKFLSNETDSPVLVLAAPIVHHDRPMGLMMLDRSPTTRSGTLLESERREFSIWDMAVIEGIAQLTGLAIEQARLLQIATSARTSEAAMREANALKDEFLAIAAHEFRSPLTVILAHTQMALRQLRRLNDQRPNAGVIDSLTSIEEQAHQLTNIVNTFLEVTQLNSGQMVMKAEVVDLAETARQVSTSHGATSPLHEISCAIASTGHPYLVKGDSSRLAQIVANLLQNAIKYSPLGGPITVSLRQYESDDSAGRRMIEVCVADKGIGIPQEALPHLFERFYRAPNVAGSKTKGIGLGLYLVAELLHLQGGNIRAESSGVLGEGSRFIFTLPALESDVSSGD